jgi:ubiquinone biosynthesis protein
MNELRANLRRFAWLVRVSILHGLAHTLGPRLVRWPRLAGLLPEVGLPAPERLRVVLETLGGTFIKFGQMLALQTDVIPFAYCHALSRLLDRVAPFGIAEVEQTFLEEVGAAPSEVFEVFETEPIATASIGQVHVAYLAGRKLAVKVQRPNVKTDFAGDIRLMRTMVRVIRALKIKSVYWMIEPLSEFIGWTAEELDYRNEARYMEQLRINARDNLVERVPEVLWRYTTPRTLVMEFFEGSTLLGYLRARETGDETTIRRLELAGFEPQRFARNVIENFLGDAFRHGLFHADLHPANLMILPDNVVGYIDFGITGVLSHYSRRHLINLTLSYTQGDLDGMCAAFFKVTAMDANSDPEGFRTGLLKMSDQWYDYRGRERRLRKNFTLVMLDMLLLSRATGIWPERDVIKYIRSAIAIDGLITRFAPGFDIGGYLAAVCDRYLRQEGLQQLVSYDRVVEWSAAAGHLAGDGGARAVRFLERATSRESRKRWPAGPPPSRSPAPAERAFRYASVTFGAAVLITVTGEPAVLGLNLFTAELLIAGASLLLFVDSLRRCV